MGKVGEFMSRKNKLKYTEESEKSSKYVSKKLQVYISVPSVSPISSCDFLQISCSFYTRYP